MAHITPLTCGDARRNISLPAGPAAQRIDGRCATLAPCPGRAATRTFDTSPHPARTVRGQPCPPLRTALLQSSGRPGAVEANLKT
ncbi:hypothetical protein DDE05_43085, partial [Streptomyces cavourensis]